MRRITSALLLLLINSLVMPSKVSSVNLTVLDDCYRKVNRSGKLLDFGQCIKKTVNAVSLTNTLLTMENNAATKQLGCCLNDFTQSLVKTDVKLFQLNYEKNKDIAGNSEKMIACAVRGDDYNKNVQKEMVSNLDKMGWLKKLPTSVKKQILEHHNCRQKKDDQVISCCADKYHDKMEMFFVTSCVHNAMLCEMKSLGNKTCQDTFENCIQRKYCNLTVSRVTYRTRDANKVKKCVYNYTKLGDQLKCVLNHKMTSLPNIAFRYLYCDQVYGTKNKRLEFFKCIIPVSKVTLPNINKQCQPKKTLAGQ